LHCGAGVSHLPPVQSPPQHSPGFWQDSPSAWQAPTPHFPPVQVPEQHSPGDWQAVPVEAHAAPAHVPALHDVLQQST
jgi:hypothetical protein